MSDFMKKYFPFYVLWLMFISFVAIGLAISTTAFGATLPTGGEFTSDFLTNAATLFWDIVTFRGDGVPALLLTLCYYLPSLPVVVWLLEILVNIIIGIIQAIAEAIPF